MHVYIDNMIWTYLIDHPDWRLTYELLTAATKAGHIRIIGSLALEEEFYGIPRSDNGRFGRYKKVRRYYNKLTAGHILLPLRERHIAETVHGGILPEPDRYLTADLQRQVRNLAYNRQAVNELADEIYAIKQASRASRIAARIAVRETLIDAGHNPVAGIRKWFTEIGPDDWLEEINAHGAANGHTPDLAGTTLTYDQQPSAWLISRTWQARTKRTVADNRKNTPSDRHDIEHCGAGAYYDTLVTNDNELAATIAEIGDMPFTVTRPDDFARELHTLLGNDRRN